MTARIDESALTAAQIRDMPINARLRRVLLAAASEAGVHVVRVTSGGQPGSRGLRTGSNRHDGGNAADLELIRHGRTLNFTRASDLETICRFVAACAAHGAIGIGAGINYMGPTRLHVGFGNGPADTSKVVWGEGGAAANAPAWLREAAGRGWASQSGGAPLPDAPPPEPPIDNGSEPGFPDVAGSPPGADVAERLHRLRDALYALIDGAAFTRAAVALFQVFMRMPVTGVVDADTSAALVRYAAFFRYAGLLAGALGVAGLIKSVGGLTADSYLEALDRFREMLGKSADPNLNQALDALRQVWEAAKPSLQEGAAAPFDAALSALGRFLPGPVGSLLAAALGIGLHRFGARIQRGFPA